VKPDNRDEERLLISRVQSGDFAALEMLYESYNRQAFGLALRILNSPEAAEDAVQDVFLRFWKTPSHFDPQKGRFITWLLGVVHNQCIDQLRRKSNNSVSLDREENQEHFSYLADDGPPVEEEVWLIIQRGIVRQALDKLPTEQRRLIELAYFKGLTRQEIATTTGQPLSTVKHRIQQGLLKLKDMMQAMEVEPGV